MDTRAEPSGAPSLKATKEALLGAIRRAGGRLSGDAIAGLFPDADWDDLYDLLLALEEDGKIRLSKLH